MVVALGALEAHAEKELGGGFGALGWLADGAIKVGGGVFIGAAAGGDDLTHELVERFVFRDGLPNPMLKNLGALAVERLFLVAQQVGPFERPEIGKLGPLQQPVDHPSPFLAMMISDERSSFLRRRQKSKEVQESSAKKNGIIAEFRRIGAQGAQLCENVVVDVIVLRHWAPFEIGTGG